MASESSRMPGGDLRLIKWQNIFIFAILGGTAENSSLSLRLRDLLF